MSWPACALRSALPSIGKVKKTGFFENLVLAIAGHYFHHPDVTIQEISGALDRARHELVEEYIRLHPKNIDEVKNWKFDE